MQSITKLKETVVDPVISGPEHAIWWTEYVLRHRGARHLRSLAVGVTYKEYFMLDILFYAPIICLVVLYLFCRVLRIGVRRLSVPFKKPLEPPAGKFKAL